MTEHTPNRSLGMQAAWILFLAVPFAAPVVQAQQPQARPPQPVYRTYQRPMAARPVARPMVARPIPIRPMYPNAMPARRPARQMVRPLPGTPAVRTSVAPYSFAQPALLAPGFRVAFQPRGAWIGAGGHFNSLLFDGWPLNAYGYWQVPPNQQMLPLGFGMWPACDSASIPGRFWSAGPCFGAGDYQSLAPNYQNEQLAQGAPQYYQPPLEFIVQPEAAPSSTTAKPSQPEKKPNMVVCLTNGNETEVSDWWVTEGRFYFVPMSGPLSGKPQTTDLNALDLQKTIEENEKRGRTFILNFTPPDERPKPATPSNQ